MRRRTKEERTAASSEAMLNAAVELIFEEGTRASMMEIGRRSGFSHSLLTARFGSKDGLLAAAVEEIRRRYHAELSTSLEQKAGIDALAVLVDTSFRSWSDRTIASRAYFTLIGEALGGNGTIEKAFKSADNAIRARLTAIIDDAKARGEIDRAWSTAGCASLFLGLMRGVGMQAKLDPDNVDIATIRETAHHLIRSLRAAPSEAP
ncbi:MAG: TetR/AcrR family transcriptional regulator [Sphingomonadales bacterium]